MASTDRLIVWRRCFDDGSQWEASFQGAFDFDVIVRCDGMGWFEVDGHRTPMVRFGVDLETGRPEAERRLGLLIEALG